MRTEMRAVLVGLLPRDERANCLGLGYLKAYAEEHPEVSGGAVVDIFDVPSDLPAPDLVKAVLRGRPRVVGFVLNLCNLREVRQACRLLRTKAPGVFIVLGAQEASLRPQALLKDMGADAVVLDEGEVTFAELLGALKRASPLEDVCGLVLRKGRRYLTTAARAPIADLSKVPSPYLTGMFPWKDASKTEAVIETSRGCPYDCSFCAWPNGVKPRHFPLERVREEVRELVRRMPTGLVHFSDPDLFLFPERARAIIGFIREADPKLRSRWWFNTYLGNMDDETAALCDHPGFIIECGIQTVNPAALKAAHRRFDPEKVRRGYQALKRRAPRARVCLQLILGLPGDDLKGFLTSLSWCYGLGADLIHVFPMQLLRGTGFHRRRAEYGVKADALPPYLVRSTALFPADDLRRARRMVYALQLFTRHPAVRAALERACAMGPLPLRAESLTRHLSARGIDMEGAFRRWDEAGSRYLTPLTIGSDPCSSAEIGKAACEWAASAAPAASRLEDQVTSVQPGTDVGVEHVLRTTFSCNERCLFCYADLTGRKVDMGEIADNLDAIRRRSPGKTWLSISGGEPAKDPRLGEIVALARAKGFSDIELQTNAVYLSRRALLDEVVARGVRTFFVSFHSFRPEVYGVLTGSRGQFPLAVRGIQNLLAHPKLNSAFQVSFNIVVNRLNAADLPAHIDFLHGLNAARGRKISVVFSLMNDAGHRKAASISVDLRDIAAPLNEAILRCRRWGIGVEKFAGACALPLCVLREPTPFANDSAFDQSEVGVYPEQFDGSRSFQRAKRADCTGCRHDRQCLGVAVEYARLHGVEALRPLPRATHLEFHLIDRCTEACTFCSEEDQMAAFKRHPVTLDEAAGVLRRKWDEGCRSVTFTGGEPTLHRDFQGILRVSKKLGYATHLITNGNVLASSKVSRRMLPLLDEILVSIPGPNAAVMDPLTRRRGSFSLLEKALRNIEGSSTNPSLGVSFVVTSSNIDFLVDAFKYAAGYEKVGYFTVASLIPAGGALRRYRELAVPLKRIAQAVPVLAKLSEKLGLGLRFCRMPICVLGETHQHLAEHLFWRDAVGPAIIKRGRDDEGRIGLAEIQASQYTERDYAAKCARCAVRDGCTGVLQPYLELFGDAELEPR